MAISIFTCNFRFLLLLCMTTIKSAKGFLKKNIYLYFYLLFFYSHIYILTVFAFLKYVCVRVHLKCFKQYQTLLKAIRNYQRCTFYLLNFRTPVGHLVFSHSFRMICSKNLMGFKSLPIYYRHDCENKFRDQKTDLDNMDP